MDRAFALRLVVFEYLLPMQKKACAAATCRAILSCESVEYVHALESHVSGMMERVQLLADRLLSARGLATSYVFPFRVKRAYNRVPERRAVDALLLAEEPTVLDEPFGDARVSDPFCGYYVFARR